MSAHADSSHRANGSVPMTPRSGQASIILAFDMDVYRAQHEIGLPAKSRLKIYCVPISKIDKAILTKIEMAKTVVSRNKPSKIT